MLTPPCLYSLGLPRVFITKTPNCLQKFQTTVYRNILPVYGTLNEKMSYWGHIEGTTKPRGGYRYCHGIPLFDKTTLFVIIFKMPNNGIPLISRHFTVNQPVYGTFNDNNTKRGIPIYRLLSRYAALWQKNRRGFHFVLVLKDVFSF